MRHNKENTSWVDIVSCLFKGLSCLVGAAVIIMLSVLVLLVLFYGLK